MNTAPQDSEVRQIVNPELYQFHPDEPLPKWMIFPNIAIMTVTFNRLEYTKKLVDSLYRKTHLPFTLYIFDQASTDGTSEYLDELLQTHSNIVVKKFKKNIGLGRAYLAAKKSVTGDILVCFDNDIEMLSNYWLVHVLKAFYAYFLATKTTDIALGIRLVNQEEYGFRCSQEKACLYIQPEENALPRTSYSMSGHNSQDPQVYLDECVCIGYTNHLCGGAWGISFKNFTRIRWEEYYPEFVGGVDSFSSGACQHLGIRLGYIENGPIARHNDWPYTDEKIRVFGETLHKRTVTDIYYLKWKFRDFLRRWK